MRQYQKRSRFKRSAFRITDTELKLMATAMMARARSRALAGMIVATIAFARNALGAGEPAGTHMQQLQTYTQPTRARMDAIQRTQDPAECRRLMQEHMQSMQAGMRMIHGMSGGRWNSVSTR